jgi:SAM-dependent methyltransferase
MLSIACSQIPKELSAQVEARNENFMTAKLEPRSYDLILCIGVLAHADSPSALIQKIASLLRPGGTVIMESTDGYHFMNQLTMLYHRMCGLFKRSTYALNLIRTSDVIAMCRTNGLELLVLYRYNLIGVPGFDRIVPQRILEKIVRLEFGTPKNNRNAWLGKECLYLLRDRVSTESGARGQSAAQVGEPVSSGTVRSAG